MTTLPVAETFRTSVAGTLLFVFSLALTACGALTELTGTAAPTPAVPATVPLPAGADAGDAAIRFLEQRVRLDPDDFIAHNKLGGYYLLRLRETGNATYLDLAKRTAEASLQAVPEKMNAGGMALLAQAEFSAHQFAAARDAAQRLLESGSGSQADRSYYYLLLGDAQTELGEYDKADEAFRQMERLSPHNIGTITRLAHHDWLHGNISGAQQKYAEALRLALSQVPPSRETVAWCRWQSGEMAFAKGDYSSAEQHYQDALTTFPDYFRALAGMARVQAARNDLTAAIASCERAVRTIPEPSLVALLGELLQLAGREKEAAAQYALVEQSGRISAAGGVLYNRQLALFYADHEIKPDKAYELARQEYEQRHDIYGADALAWTALKSGRVAEAWQFMQQALRLGTTDARLFYHAGMIARAAGNEAEARNYLRRALALNPCFDPFQSAIARKAAAE